MDYEHKNGGFNLSFNATEPNNLKEGLAYGIASAVVSIGRGATVVYSATVHGERYGGVAGALVGATCGLAAGASLAAAGVTVGSMQIVCGLWKSGKSIKSKLEKKEANELKIRLLGSEQDGFILIQRTQDNNLNVVSSEEKMKNEIVNDPVSSCNTFDVHSNEYDDDDWYDDLMSTY